MIFTRAILPLFVVFIIGCNRSNDNPIEIVTEEREMDSFNQINISGEYELVLAQGDKEKLEIRGNKKDLANIVTKSKKNTLHISNKGVLSDTEPIKLFITIVDLHDVIVYGSVDIRGKGKITVETLDIVSRGSSEIELDVDAYYLNLDLSGGSDTEIEGSATNFITSISGVGHLEAKKLVTNNAKVDISGAGTATVNVRKKLDVDISGAGTVSYEGDPIVKSHLSGAGFVKKYN